MDEKGIKLDLLRQGDAAEFNKLVEAYSSRLYRLVLRIVGEQKDAEDVLQEVFIKVYKNIGGFEGRSSLSTWLFRITTNEALIHLRKRSPSENVALDEIDEDEYTVEKPTIIVDWSNYPEEVFSSTESKEFINRAIQELTLPLRMVFLLRDVEGLSIKETMDTLDIAESAVKLRLLRARLKMREKLTEYFIEYASKKVNS